jgi:phosphatidate cytidylyltransferase
MLKYRLMSGSVLIGLLLCMVFTASTIGTLLFMGLALFFVIASLSEFYSMCGKIDSPGYKLSGVTAAALLVAAPALQAYGLATVPTDWIFALLIGCTFLLAFRESDQPLAMRRAVVTLGGFLYLGWMLSFIPKLYFLDGVGGNGRYLFFFLILVTKCGDIGGYFAGTATARRPGGNHKLVPRLSPKKSWEGLFGGIALSALVGAILAHTLGDKLGLSLGAAAFLGLLFTIVGLAGDLAESLVKRAAGVKDSGATIPGMGGMMDVIDSLVFVAPFFYLALPLLAGQ